MDISAKIEAAAYTVRGELAAQAGGPMAAIAEQVLFNALADAAVRAEAKGVSQERAMICFLHFCRRVCDLAALGGNHN